MNITPRIPRYDEAQGLRQEGLSYRQIAARLAVPLSTAHRWVKASTESPTGSGEAIPEGQGATDLPSLFAEVQDVDLSTPASVLSELDALYDDIRRRGYSASSALRLRALSVVLDALRRKEPPPCEDHLTAATVSGMIQKLVQVVVWEFQNHLAQAASEDRAVITESVEALFCKVRDRFNGCLKAFDQEAKIATK